MKGKGYFQVAVLVGVLLLFNTPQAWGLANFQAVDTSSNNLKTPQQVQKLHSAAPGLLWHNSDGKLNPAGEEVLFLIELLAFTEQYAQSTQSAHSEFVISQLELLGFKRDKQAALLRREQLLSDSLLLMGQRFLSHSQYGSDGSSYAAWRQRLTDAQGAKQRLQRVRELQPAHRNYHQLRPWFEQYQALAKADSWPRLHLDQALTLGDQSAQVAQLRQRMTMLGDLEPQKTNDPNSIRSVSQARAAAGLQLPAGATTNRAGSKAKATVYDQALMAAVQRFQRRHGFEASGQIDQRTLDALNVHPRQRKQQIAMTLLRWLDEPLPVDNHYILVNVPDFKLRYVHEGESKLEMAVIVGKPEHSTPVFSADISQIVLNPTWTPTHNIIVNELVPKFARDPDAFERNEYKLYSNWKRNSPQIPVQQIDWTRVPVNPFPYKIVQQAGPLNPLGKFKFNLPNHHQVYLHDTSAPYLFAREQRAFSHGCIRLEKPRELAVAILASQEHLDEQEVSELLEKVKRPKTTYLNLRHRVTVHVVYWTAWVDENGQLHFREDLYQRDT